MNLSSVISQMGILLALIVLGYAAAKCGVLPENANRVLSQLVILITNPCTVLHSALASEHALSNRQVLVLTGIALGCFAVMIAVGQLLPRLLRVPNRDRGVYIFMTTFSNMGFMGFPVTRALYGEGAVFYAAIFNLIFQLVVYTYGASLLAPKQGKQRLSWRVLCSPIILASVLGYVCYLTDLHIPAPITEGLGMLGAVTSPVCMLVIGVALSKVPLGSVFTNWRLYVLYGVRLLALPLAVYGLLHPFVENQLMLGIPAVMLGMPAATLSAILAAQYQKNEALAASGVFLSTLMSFVTIPLLMWALA